MADEDDDIAEVERAMLSGLRSSEKASEKAAVATVAGFKAEIGEDIRKNAEELGIMLANFFRTYGGHLQRNRRWACP